MLKKSLIFILVFILTITDIEALVLSDFPYDEMFHVYSLSYEDYEEIGSFNTYEEADKVFTANKDYYNNLAIFSNGYFYKAEYAIVAFNYTDKCDYNVEFINDFDNESNYTNGCYGIDGAYLDTNSKGTKVKFKLSGVDGWADFKDVIIYPIQLLPGRLTKYKVIEGNLFHQIKHSFNNDYYSSIINLGKAPDYLTEGLEYYSYDGHYFYNDDSLWLMLADYQSGNFDNSLNWDNPYYNYYQYLSNRTLTAYSKEVINDYLVNTLHIDGLLSEYKDYEGDSINDNLTKSQFYKQIDSFYQYQYQYGANALMMISLSMNESATGRSSLAFTRNNLFGHSAFDSDVEKNASRYLTLSSSIYSHARYYISNSYCNPKKFQYKGCFFGNKSGGMNVSYASDPYWGEKAAQNFYLLDSYFGLKDLNKYTVGIKSDFGSVNIYQDASINSPILYKTTAQKDVSFIILEAISNEEGNFYKIQSDATLNDDKLVDYEYYYDFNNDIGYIKQSDVQVILKGNNVVDEMVKVTFDAQEGSFRDTTNLVSYYMEKGKIPSCEIPVLANNLFVGWDKELTDIENDETYYAVYKEVSSIEMKNIPLTQYEIKDRINLTDGSIMVYFVDGSSEEVKLDTNMVSGYDFNVAGDQEVIVTYGGKTTSYQINASEELDVVRNEIKEEILSLIDELGDKETLTEDEKHRVLALKTRIDEYMIPSLNQARIRAIDRLFLLSFDEKINYIVNKNDLDASVSGLALSIKLNDSLNKSFIKDTYKLKVVESAVNNKLTQVAEGNNYTVFNGLQVSLENNFEEANISGPIIISVKKPQGASENQLFSVLYYNDGEVYDLYTTQTGNYIRFLTDGLGEFLIVAKNTTNTYDIEDEKENITVENSDPDILILIIYGLITVAGLLVLGLIIGKLKKHDQQKNIG